ncbi:MAG: hypothetical protein V4792_03380 [Pseudomonadota bacterium]
MRKLILDHLARLLPQAEAIEPVHAWINEDISWHSSSFELARGLEVIELRSPSAAVFADTMPAFHPARA